MAAPRGRSSPGEELDDGSKEAGKKGSIAASGKKMVAKWKKIGSLHHRGPRPGRRRRENEVYLHG